MNAQMAQEMVTVSMVLGFGTLCSIAATMFSSKASEHVMWFALTLVQGFGFMLSLLILMGGAQ
jgi:hypothetical protein